MILEPSDEFIRVRLACLSGEHEPGGPSAIVHMPQREFTTGALVKDGYYKIGDRNDLFLLDAYALEEYPKTGARLQLGEFHLVVVREADFGLAFYAAPERWYWFWRVWFGLGGFYRWLRARIVLTCYVWGLATVTPYKVIEWSDIKFLRWLKCLKKNPRC